VAVLINVNKRHLHGNRFLSLLDNEFADFLTSLLNINEGWRHYQYLDSVLSLDLNFR
jgi:hypothetical protein